jgi:hypothetical protein
MVRELQLLAGTPKLEAQSVEFLDQHENRATCRDRALAVRFRQRLPPPSQLLDLRLVQTHGLSIPLAEGLSPKGRPADDDGMSWASIVAVALLSWIGIAVVVGTIVGHGIAVGTDSDLF